MSSALFNTFILGATSANWVNKYEIFIPNNRNLPNELYKPIIYSWALNPTLKSQHEPLFGLNSNKKTESLNLLLFHNLFKATYFISKLRESELEVLKLLEFLGKNNSYILYKVDHFQPNLMLMSNNWYSLLIDFSIFNSLKPTQNTYPNEIFQWLVTPLNANRVLSTSNSKPQCGLFTSLNLSYLNLTNLSTKSTELIGLRDSTNSQISLIRQNRWLYKYTILHRASFLNASYITLTKKLLNKGFYDSSLLTSNVWASSSIKHSKLQQSLFGDLIQLLYGDNFTNTNLTAHNCFTQLNTLNFLNISSLANYEPSYYWFLNRSFALTTLPSNTAQFLPTPYSHGNLTQQNAILNYATRDLELINAAESLLLAPWSLHLKKSSNLGELKPLSTPVSRDIYLKYSEFNLFSKAQLDILLELNTNFSVPTYTYYSPKLL